MISEFTHILVNILSAGLMGLLIWLSVELSVERLRDRITKGRHSQETPDLTGDFWVQHALQSMNLVIVAVLFGGPIEVRWVYFALGFGAGAVLCGFVYHLARLRKIQVDLEWLFR